jgi:hypothetical protein
MGLEAQCSVRVGRRSGSGTALLESKTLVFRGDVRLSIPFDSIREAHIEGGALLVRTRDQEARLELGAATAERWLRAIQEPKGLLEKLELDAQSRVAVVDVHDAPFLGALRERTILLGEGRVPAGAAVIFFGADTREALRRLPLLRTRMPAEGVLWVLRPKASKTIAEADVFAALREASLVDTKVVSFSRTHTAHKAVIPVELRGRPIPKRAIVSLPPQAIPAISQRGDPMEGLQRRSKSTGAAKSGPASTRSRARVKRDQ